jgi:DNA-binding NtrC family response regulator
MSHQSDTPGDVHGGTSVPGPRTSSSASPSKSFISDRQRTIAVINSSDDTVDMLRVCLQQHGFTSVVTAHVPDIKQGKLDFLTFVAAHDPAVFIYDVSIPYDENWRFLQLLMSSEHMRGRTFVVTTTNKRALEQLVGPTEAFEIIGKPYDIDQIVQAVEKALA